MDYDNLFGIGIPYILLNMLSCHGFLNNNESIVILKCPNRMSEYYFNKGLIESTCDEDNLNILPLSAKQRVGAQVKVNSDKVMICKTTIISTSNTLKNLVISSYYHSSYSTEKFNSEKEEISRLFSTYVTPQIKEINHPAIIQEWKLNIDAAEYEKNMAKSHLPSHKKKINRQDNHDHWPASIKSTLQWFPFRAIME